MGGLQECYYNSLNTNSFRNDLIHDYIKVLEYVYEGEYEELEKLTRSSKPNTTEGSGSRTNPINTINTINTIKTAVSGGSYKQQSPRDLAKIKAEGERQRAINWKIHVKVSQSIFPSKSLMDGWMFMG